MTDHPITPPPELVQQWMNDICNDPDGDPHFVSSDDRALAARAAQWGSDLQLEVDAEWLDEYSLDVPHLTTIPTGKGLVEAMRPKPPSLKRVALLRLDTLNADLGLEGKGIDLSQIRRALEALPDD